MADISSFIKSHLLSPLKQYPTAIQDTMIDLITEKLQELYDYSVEFPSIVSPNINRLDILKAIADQFLFTIREEADLQEQINILENILYVYSSRGSIDTIENMWKYYGGDLPKDVKVIVPSYNLFRYSVSKLSGNHVFQDNTVNRTGVYEIRLTNNTYPIPDLRDFLLRELVAAGNYIYFTNTIHLDVNNLIEGSNHYYYDVHEDTLIDIKLEVLKHQQGFTWSGHNPLSKKSEDSAWSGRGSIFLELTHMIDLNMAFINTYSFYAGEGFNVESIPSLGEIVYECIVYTRIDVSIESSLYCTPSSLSMSIARYLYNRQGSLLESSYPGYFVLGETLLGTSIV